MDPPDILRARGLTALAEGNHPEAERIFSSVLADSGDCVSMIGLAIARLRQNKDTIDLSECERHPAIWAYRVASAGPSEVVGVLERIDGSDVEEYLPLLVNSVELRAAELLASGDYGGYLKAFERLSRIEGDGDRASWSISTALETMERNGHHATVRDVLSDLDEILRSDVMIAIERLFDATVESERFERAVDHVKHFDFLDANKLITSLLRFASNAEEYGNVREVLSSYRLASDLSGDPEIHSHSASRVRDLARKAIDRGEMEQALELLVEAVVFDEIDVQREYLKIAHGYVREGRYDEAIGLYMDIEERYPGSKTVYHLKDIANRLKSEHRIEEAIGLYERIKALDADFDIDHYLLLVARDLLDRGEHVEALRVLEGISSVTTRVLRYRSEALFGTDDREKGMAHLRRALKGWPEDTAVLGALSDALEEDDEIGRAAELAIAAMELDPGLDWARKRVKAHLKDRIEEAETARDYPAVYDRYTRFLETFPGDPWASERRDICLSLMRHTDRKAWKRITLASRKGNKRIGWRRR